MDLRGAGLDSGLVELGAKLLNYQPFILSDDVQTGVGYTIALGAAADTDIRAAPPLVFRRGDWPDKWDRITDANQRLRTMYEDFLDAIVERYPGGSLLDVACNNGYFPVGASRRGMKRCVGSDLGAQYVYSIAFLNKVLGTNAGFVHAPYDPLTRTAPDVGTFDVVVASAIMCHLPDPLNFLAYLGSVAKEAIFYWGQVIHTDALVAGYLPRHPDLGGVERFPYGFNDNTRISLGMFRYAGEVMGFRNMMVLPWRDTWLPTYGATSELSVPRLSSIGDGSNATPDERAFVKAAYDVGVEILTGGSRLEAILLTR